MSWLRLLARRLVRAPLFTAVALITLGVGIGANAAIFSLVNGVLLKPLPYDDPDALVDLGHRAPGLGFDDVPQSPATYFTYRDDARSFVDVGVWSPGQSTVTGLDEPERVDAMRVTDGTLGLLGVQPVLGRLFTASDDLPDAPLTVVLGHGYWQRRFAGDAGVLGRTLNVDGRTREIIGVLPDGVRFLDQDVALYLPYQWDRSQVQMGNFSYQGLARLRPGVTLAQATQEVDRLIPVAAERFPGGLTLGMLEEAGFAARLVPLRERVVGDVGQVLWVLLGTVAVVLLIACANVANLFLVRAEARQRELALRTALGAGRGRMMGQFLQESVALGLVGGAVGLALAALGLRALRTLGPDTLPRMHEVGLEPRVLLFTLGVSLLAGVLFGLFPVLRYGRPDLVGQLKEGGRGGDSRGRHRIRNGLVVAQMALALVLLVGSGLMIRSFQALRTVDPGFREPGSLLTVRISIPSAEIPEPERVALTHEEILRRVEALPGVVAAALASSVPMDGAGSNDALFVEGHEPAGEQLPPIRRFKWISPGYVGTMGNALVAGRDFTWADIHDRAPVVLVTEDFTREFWDTPAQAVGQRVRQFPGTPWREIVGVVASVHDDGVDQPTVPTVYWPMVVADFWDAPLFTQRSLRYVVRTAGDVPPGLLGQLRDAAWAVNPNLPLAEVRTMADILSSSMARTTFTLVMLGIAAGVALLLGTVGIYGVISYVVAQRTREIGVRMALGAQASRVRRMVLRQGLVLAAGGVGLGLVAAAVVSRLLASLLFGVKPVDPVTYMAVAAVLASVALVASYLPAWRAARVDPMEALRGE